MHAIASYRISYCFIALFAACFMWSVASTAEAQQISPVLTPDEHAYIYHDQLPRLGYGYNIYRQYAGETERLNDQPVFAANSGPEFRSRIGNDRFNLLADGYETTNPQEVFFRLRGDEFDRTFLALSFPEIAEALGLLYVDEDPVIGEQVTYRFELINQRGEPTGDTFESEVVVVAVDIEQPTGVEAERDGRELSITWNYPGATLDPDDIIIRFEVYKRAEGEEYFTNISEESRLRLQDQTAYSYLYESADFPERAEILVEAIDVTGQNTIASDPIEVELVDLSQPPAVLEVHSRVVDGVVELTWPVSPDPNVAGYHIDRVNADTDETARLTEELIDVRNPQFRDDTIEPDYYYHYYVIPVSNHGVESERGNPAVENIVPVHFPDPPSNLTAEVNEEERTIELQWEGIEQDDMFNTYVVLRRVYRDGEERKAFSQVNDERLTEERITDEGIAGEGFTEGVFYEYGLVSANKQGRRSDTVFTIKQMPMVTPPEPPSSFEAEIRNENRVNLIWGASPSTTVTSYHIYRTTEPADTTVISKPRSRRYYSDREVEIGETFRYYVTAVDSAGNESEPTRKSEIFMRSETAPATVRNVHAVETETGVELWWEPSTAEDLEGYMIKRAELSTGRFEPITEEPIENTEWVDENGEAGKWYQVFAVDEFGNMSRPGDARQAVRND